MRLINQSPPLAARSTGGLSNIIENSCTFVTAFS